MLLGRVYMTFFFEVSKSNFDSYYFDVYQLDFFFLLPWEYLIIIFSSTCLHIWVITIATDVCQVSAPKELHPLSLSY